MPRHKITNTFMKGMNKDKTWTKSDPDSYRESSNLRPITDDMGDSTGSLSTVKGNSFNYEFPKLYKTWMLKGFDEHIRSLSGKKITVTFNINGKYIDFVHSSISGDVFYEALAKHINDNSSAFGSGVKAQFSEDAVAVYSETYEEISGLGGDNISAVVLGNSVEEFVVIGETTIRDVSILLTTDKFNRSNAIWKVVWDKDDKPTLTLIRHGSDNFSTYHDIEALGRYELKSIQKIYWTDYNNDLRSLNIESPSSFLDQIDLTKNVKYTIPYVKKINQAGGKLGVGWYSYSYRQKILSGIETAFSRWSAPIPVLKSREGSNHIDYILYVGSMEGESTTKSLTVEITEMDKTFTHIDVIGMYQDDLSSKGVYFYVEKEVELTGSGSYEFTHREVESTVSISPEEIFLPTTIFNKCKTIAIKDNRLLVGNVRNEVADVDDYDARAIRYQKYAYTTETSYETTIDQKNPYNKDSTKVSNTEAKQHKYKRGTHVQGGTGTNISYEFVQREFQLDRYKDQHSPTEGGKGIHAVSEILNRATVNNRVVQMGGYWNCFKNPFFASHFRGYLRSEVYRFGIVFFNKAGTPLEVKWIDDIRMPDQSTEFPAFKKSWAADTRGYSLGVKFFVSVPKDFKNTVSGFSIVRAERKTDDESVKAQGMMTDLSEIKLCYRTDKGGPDKKNEWGSYLFRNIRQGFYGAVDEYRQGSKGDPTLNKICASLTCLHVPKMLLKNWSFDFKGYKIRPVSVVDATSRNVLNSNNRQANKEKWMVGGDGDRWRWTKFFDVVDGGYYGDNNNGDCYKNLSNEIEKSSFMPGVNIVNVGIGGEALSNFEGTDIINGLAGARWRALLNFAWPHDRNSLAGSYDRDRLIDSSTTTNNQVMFRGRGGSPCHLAQVNVSKHRKLYFSEKGKESEIARENSRVGPSEYWQADSGAQHLGHLKDNVDHQWWLPKIGRRVIFNIYREIDQYGGASKNDILETEYISTGHFQPVNATDTTDVYECDVYGGDTYVSIWSENTMATHNSSGGFEAYEYAFSPTTNANEAFGDASLIPIESKLNFEWRQGININNVDVAGGPAENDAGSESKNFINWNDDLDTLTNPASLDANWQRRQNNHKAYLSLGSFRNETDEWDNRIWASQNKINGESLDSWAVFKPFDFKDVDGNLGPVNKLESFNNEVFYFQDRAFGKLVVNPTPMISGDDGVMLNVLGSGKPIHDFNYVSTSVGTKHQWSVFSTPSSIYWFDILNKKPYRFSGQTTEELSDMKGMHSFFLSNVDNTLIDTDNPARDRGIRGTYDFLNNEALFTFLNSKRIYTDSNVDFNRYGPDLGGIGGLIPEGSLVSYGGSKSIFNDDGSFLKKVSNPRVFDVIKSYPISSSFTGGPGSLIPLTNRTEEFLRERPSYLSSKFTIGFSEVLNAWSTFYNFAPTIYINTKSRLLTPSSFDKSMIYLHNAGKYNKFYGDVYESILEVVTNQAPDQTKVYDNVSWHTKARKDIGAGGVTLDQVTFDEYYCYNDYQHSGIIELSRFGGPNKDVRRVEREWQTFIPRNVVEFTPTFLGETGSNVDVLNPINWNLSREYSDRIRDKYLVQRFKYDASRSDQFIINYINTYVRTSSR